MDSKCWKLWKADVTLKQLKSSIDSLIWATWFLTLSLTAQNWEGLSKTTRNNEQKQTPTSDSGKQSLWFCFTHMLWQGVCSFNSCSNSKLSQVLFLGRVHSFLPLLPWYYLLDHLLIRIFWLKISILYNSFKTESLQERKKRKKRNEEREREGRRKRECFSWYSVVFFPELKSISF